MGKVLPNNAKYLPIGSDDEDKVFDDEEKRYFLMQ